MWVFENQVICKKVASKGWCKESSTYNGCNIGGFSSDFFFCKKKKNSIVVSICDMVQDVEIIHTLC